MKRLLLFIVILCASGVSMSLMAQKEDNGRKERFEKFQAERVAFISKQMKLTEEEKSAFWPLCDELQMKKFEANKPLRDETQKIRKAQKENTPISQDSYKKLVELSAEIKLKEAQLEKEYNAKFLKVIPAEKVFLYQKAEQEFGRNMMEKRRDRN